MYRVIALGFYGGDIVDRLRALDSFEDIEFVYCDTDERLCYANGREGDRHIVFTDFDQCREAIHTDNELMAVLVADLGDESARKYAVDVMYELWSYADHTYFFGIMPMAAGHMREKAEPVFKELHQWSDLSVIQDNLKLPPDVFFVDMNTGLARLLSIVLTHPKKYKSEDAEELPFGVWATEKQLHAALQGACLNRRKFYPTAMLALSLSSEGMQMFYNILIDAFRYRDFYYFCKN